MDEHKMYIHIIYKMKLHSVISLLLTLMAIIVIGMFFDLYGKGKENYNNNTSVDLNDPHNMLVYQGYAPIGAEALPAAWDNKRDGVSVDGTNKYPPSLFVFAYNQSSPQCCFGPNASGYSTSRGCVCLTEQQKQYLTQAQLQPKCT
jgi:hypothetical protein